MSKKMDAVELFSRCGDWHTIAYASQVSSLEAWEHDPIFEKCLKMNLPMAKIKITDSYKEIKKTRKKFDLIVVDNPWSMHDDHCEHFDLFPDIFRVAKNSAILVLNIIPEFSSKIIKEIPSFKDQQFRHRISFYKTDKPEKISFNRIVRTYKNLITTNGFSLEWSFFQKRSFVYYLVLKIKRK